MIWMRAAYAAGLGRRDLRLLGPPREQVLPDGPVVEDDPEHPDGLPPRPSGTSEGVSGVRARESVRRALGWAGRRGLPVGAVLGLAAYLRFRQLAAVGFNSDEAVYTGSAEALSGNHALVSMFPVLLFTSLQGWSHS